jgi:hypothetical protein
MMCSGIARDRERKSMPRSSRGELPKRGNKKGVGFLAVPHRRDYLPAPIEIQPHVGAALAAGGALPVTAIGSRKLAPHQFGAIVININDGLPILCEPG